MSEQNYPLKVSQSQDTVDPEKEDVCKVKILVDSEDRVFGKGEGPEEGGPYKNSESHHLVHL